MKYILNLTGVPATPEQVFDGVIELVNSELKERLVNALSFDKVPLFKEVEERAELIEDIFVEDTEIRTGLKLKEISKNSGKEIPLWSKLKEMDIGVMLNTNSFMVSKLEEVLSTSAKIMYSVFKTEPILDYSNIIGVGYPTLNLCKGSKHIGFYCRDNDVETVEIYSGDVIYIDVLNSVIKVNDEMYNISMIGNSAQDTNIVVNGDKIIITGCHINNVYEFKRDLPLRDARDALKPSFFRKAGRFKIIGKVNND